MRTIAKDDGVPPPGGLVDSPYSTLLVVPDDLVETVLADVGAEQLPGRVGEPLATGWYADFDGADDLEPGEVLALWYSGQSGSCPTYLRGLRVTAGGDLDVDEPETGEGACTADYNPYRQLVVVPEDAVPELTRLPLILGGESESGADDLLVDVYPTPSAP